MLKQENRLRKKSVISALLRKGKVYKSRYFICRYFLKDEGSPRFSVAVSKKIDKRAVFRNRLKRRFREVIKKNLDKSPPIYAMFFLSRFGEKADFKSLEDELLLFFKKILN